MDSVAVKFLDLSDLAPRVEAGVRPRQTDHRSAATRVDCGMSPMLASAGPRQSRLSRSVFDLSHTDFNRPTTEHLARVELS
jgi:hypothetical protein